MQTGEIIEAAEQYVKEQYQAHPHPNLVYHNLVHTRQVVEAAGQIAAHYRLQDNDLAIVYVAAWFHDLGYLLGEPRQHEDAGASLARSFLQQQQAPQAMQDQVAACILATKMPQNPQNLLEQIVCDADLFHLGVKEFKDRNKLLRQEIEMTLGHEIPTARWRESSLHFLEQHHYHTTYCRALLQQQKDENLRWIRSKLEKALAKEGTGAEETPAVTGVTAGNETAVAGKPKKEKDKEKSKRPERGVETMFRTTSTNHIRLSAMADSKANIMISVNSIIVSVILGVLFRKLEDYPNLVIPAFIFLVTGVATIIFSVLATRPNVTSGRFTRSDIDSKKTNLLFFGNFHEMSLDDYKWGMTEMMKDGDYLYGSMIQDIFHLGVVLGKKYRRLRIAYNIFMYGLIISVLAFLVAAIFFPVRNF